MKRYESEMMILLQRTLANPPKFITAYNLLEIWISHFILKVALLKGGGAILG